MGQPDLPVAGVGAVQPGLGGAPHRHQRGGRAQGQDPGRPLRAEHAQGVPGQGQGRAGAHRRCRQRPRLLRRARARGHHTLGGRAGGGIPALRGTGFFRVEKQGGRWLLVDPDGNPCFHLGICSFAFTEDYTYTLERPTQGTEAASAGRPVRRAGCGKGGGAAVPASPISRCNLSSRSSKR